MNVFEAIKGRRSIRRYSEKPVPRHLIEKIINAGTYAPSGANLQPWKFVCVDDPYLKREIAEGAKYFFIKSHHVGEAPVLIVCLADLKKSRWAVIDVSLACQNIMLAAHALGLGTCFIGVFDERRIRELLNIPESYALVGLITLGYPQGQEKAPPRRPVSDVLSFNGFEVEKGIVKIKSQVKSGPLSILGKVIRMVLRPRRGSQW